MHSTLHNCRRTSLRRRFRTWNHPLCPVIPASPIRRIRSDLSKMRYNVDDANSPPDSPRRTIARKHRRVLCFHALSRDAGSRGHREDAETFPHTFPLAVRNDPVREARQVHLRGQESKGLLHLYVPSYQDVPSVRILQRLFRRFLQGVHSRGHRLQRLLRPLAVLVSMGEVFRPRTNMRLNIFQYRTKIT